MALLAASASLLLTLIATPVFSAPAAEPAPEPRLTVELRDGSRVVRAPASQIEGLLM